MQTISTWADCITTELQKRAAVGALYNGRAKCVFKFSAGSEGLTSSRPSTVFCFVFCDKFACKR